MLNKKKKFIYFIIYLIFMKKKIHHFPELKLFTKILNYFI
jgi:hypothetical protein